MGKTLRLVLDVLKPHDPLIVTLAGELSDLNGIDNVNISIYEIDRRVENAKITIEGTDIDYDQVLQVLTDNGATVHSLDEAVAGFKIIDDAETLQDPGN